MNHYKSKIIINDTDRKVTTYLKEIGVSMRVHFVVNNENDPEWRHDLWRVYIGDYSTDYKTGLGHRVKGKVNTKPLRDLYGIDRGEIVKLTNYIRSTDNIHAVLPTQASILCCLLLDSEAIEYSFNEWCDNFGYDPDSFTTFNIYQACCKTGEELRKVFKHDQIEHLRELLEDY